MTRIHKAAAFAAVLLMAGCATAPAPPARPAPVMPPTAHSPNALTPTNSARAINDPRIRVGMLSEQTSVSFPRTPGGYLIVTDSGPSTLRRGFTASAPVRGVEVRYAVQVSALLDQDSAGAFAEKVRTATGARADSLFEPAGGVYRVLAGDFPDADAARPLRDQIVTQGFAANPLIVRRPADKTFVKELIFSDDEGDQATLTGESVLVLPLDGETVSIDKKLYRGGARLWINSRGLLNIINELNLEDYLRGVVPTELGPKIFDELEAQKAQALAARTYAVRNLGQFRAEGYDICPGPSCQAYAGFSGEDPLSDQAVKETAGMVITYQGQPIDALFTSTCGGETSDVDTMFPGRTDPYLKRARCVEMEMTSIPGRADRGMLSELQMNALVFAAVAGLEPAATWSARGVEAAVGAAMRLIGSTPPAGVRAASSRRGDVLVYLAALAGLQSAGRVLTLPEDRQYFFPQTAPLSTPHEAAAFLIKYGLVPSQDIDRTDLSAAMPRDELYSLLGFWLRKHEALGEISGKISAVEGRNIVLKVDAKRTPFVLPTGIPVFRKLGDRYQEYRSVPVMIGDRANLQVNSRNAILALIVQANYDGASFDRTSNFANWTRSYRADQLVTSIAKRNPIKQLIALRPTRVDESNRIAEMEVTAEGGRTFVLKGLPIRWSLNVPDNLFVIDKSVDPDGVDRYTFLGKGWGHGIGMCQVGAYGMAFRGWTVDRIIKRYYAGVEITPMK